jgi:hypothetical protein
MKRRAFIKGSLTASAMATLASTTIAAGQDKPREYYELRAYHLDEKSNREALEKYLRDAAIPALNRAGAKTVGAFTEIEPKGNPSIYLVIPYDTLEVFTGASTQLANDAELRQAAADYLQTPKNQPAFQRIDSWLLLAFAGMPKLELPSYSKSRQPRIFEMRTYESYSEEKALRKVEMFNSGEIDVMHEVGLGPIFYGQGLVGSNLPHLTYMLSGENREEYRKHWTAFTQHPVWKKLSADPKYADTVSKITSIFLKPTDYSQI